MMLSLFALDQHDALSKVQNQLRPEEMLFAFLDDISVVCPREGRRGPHHLGKCVVGSCPHPGVCRQDEGLEPGRCQTRSLRFPRAASLPCSGTGANVAKRVGDRGERTRHQGLGDTSRTSRVRGAPVVGRATTPANSLRPNFPDVQSAWALLLHCATARANYFFRVVPPDNSHPYVVAHDNALWRCLCAVLRVPEDMCAFSVRKAVFAFGGIGRSAVRPATTAYWASWEDSLEMIAQRHPRVVETFVRELEGPSDSHHLRMATRAGAIRQSGRFRGAVMV